MKERDIVASDEKVARVVELIKERVYFPQELWDKASYFFVAPESYNEQVIKKRWKEETPTYLNKIIEILQQYKPFDKVAAHDAVMAYIQGNELNMGQVMNSFRLSIVGDAKGPDLFEVVDILGVDEVVTRIRKAIAVIVK